MKRKHYILLGVLALLIITNPSITAFKAYSGESRGVTKPVNLFIASVYSVDGDYEYVGLMGNFIKVKSPKPVDYNANKPNPDSVFSDSMVDTPKHPAYPKGFTPITNSK